MKILTFMAITMLSLNSHSEEEMIYQCKKIKSSIYDSASAKAPITEVKDALFSITFASGLKVSPRYFAFINHDKVELRFRDPRNDFDWTFFATFDYYIDEQNPEGEIIEIKEERETHKFLCKEF